MKQIWKRILKEAKDAFWSQVPYLIWSFVWLMLSMFWATMFLKWFMNKYFNNEFI
tara:strand:+ start:3119 stop:3283 length:165 start_codon:yes stop_codon:yes gene_type:complete